MFIVLYRVPKYTHKNHVNSIIGKTKRTVLYNMYTYSTVDIWMMCMMNKMYKNFGMIRGNNNLKV